MPSSPRRFTPHLLSAAALASASTLGISAPANAAMTVECTTSGISCLSFSGYAGKSVWNYPVNSTGNNCVNYAAYRLSRNGLANPGNLGSGGDWASRAKSYGYPVNQTPAAGSIAQWNYGSHYAPSSGHVAYVEEVDSTGIVISESAWSGGSKRYRLTTGDANWPSNFIHFKDVGYKPPPNGTFIRDRNTNAAYRLANGAPVYVTTFSAFGGPQPTMGINNASLKTLPAKVPDGTFLQATGTGEVYRIVGSAPIFVSTWSTYGGTQPRTVVDAAVFSHSGTGYYSRINYYPHGVYASAINPATGNTVAYYLKNGYAYWLSSWSQVGGPKPTLRIDWAAIQNAGKSGKYAHIRGVLKYGS